FLKLNIIFNVTAENATTNRPLLSNIDRTEGNCDRASDANSAPTPKAILVPTIIELALSLKSTDESMDIPAAVIVPNNPKVAPPITGFGMAAIKAHNLGDKLIPRIIKPAVIIVDLAPIPDN